MNLSELFLIHGPGPYKWIGPGSSLVVEMISMESTGGVGTIVVDTRDDYFNIGELRRGWNDCPDWTWAGEGVTVDEYCDCGCSNTELDETKEEAV